MLGKVIGFAVALITIGIASIHHFGGDGIAIPIAIWLLMPYEPAGRG